MTKAVAEVLKKELRELYHGGKVAVGVALVLTIVPLTTLALLQSFSDRRDDLQRTANLLKLSDPASVPYSGVRFHGLRTPLLTEIFNEGVATDFPLQFSLPRHALADPTARQVFDRPLLSSLPANDLRFVFQLLFPLVAIALSFALVSGERERGTLALLCSHPIPRRSILFGKMLAGAALLAVLLLLAHASASLVVLLSGIAPPLGFTAFLALHFAASYLWTLAFFLLGILASGTLPSSNQAAMLLLAAWALLVLVVPAALPSLLTSASRYSSQQSLYEETWPLGARMFTAAQEWSSPMELSFSEGMVRDFARQPGWSDVAVSLSSQRWKAKLFCSSDGSVVVRTKDQRLLRGLEERLPPFLKEQSEAGRRLFEVRFQRFLRLLKESESMDQWSVLLPIAAYNQITASLAGSDAASYLSFVQELNQRKEDYFLALEARSDFQTRRFFTLPVRGGETARDLEAPVWEKPNRLDPSSRPRPAAWLALLTEDLLLALAATAVFSRTPPR